MENTVGFALIGAGLVGPRHARFINESEGGELKMVCDLRQDRGQPLADQYGALWSSDYHEALARDDVDVLTICLPTALHLEVATAAAESGKHVLVEKPIEINVERAVELIDVCKRNGVRLGAILNRRFIFGSRRLRQAVQNGELGDIILADMRFKSWRPAAYYDESGWRGTWDKEGGGALINQGIHGVDLLTWIAGPIKDVQGHARHLRHTQIEADDTTVAVCELESGALGVIECTTSVHPRQPDRIEVHGQKGSVALEDYQIVDWQVDDVECGAPTPEELALPGAEAGTAVGHYLQVRDMVRAVRDDRAPAVTGEDALHALAVVQAIYESEASGRRVEVTRFPAS